MTLQHMTSDVAPRETQGPVAFYTPLQAHFLARLRRLDVVLQEMESAKLPWPELRTAVDWAFVTTVADCIAEGLADEVHRVARVEEHRRTRL